MEIAQILGRDIVGSTGEMKIFDNGLIQGDNWYIARSNGAVDGFTPATNNLQATGVWRVLRRNQVENESMALARKEFDSFGPEWKKINPHTGKEMFNNQSGGYVVCHKQHNITVGSLDSESEFAIAEALAGDGKKVKLLNEKAPKGVKTPDAEILNEGVFDFKNVNATSERNIATNVQQYVMNPSARSNAEGLVFNIKDNPNATPAAINQGIIDAIKTVANDINLAKKIGVVYSNGKTKIISIEEFKIENGARF